jgi:hypothetical protein
VTGYAQVERRRRTARELGLRPPNIRPGGSTLWTAEELDLLGTMSDEDLARQLGRTETAVRVKRIRRAVAKDVDRRRRGEGDR